MEKTFEGWDSAEWANWVLELEQLSLEQLAQLTEDVGITFGNAKPTTKQAYILVLDEADHRVLKEKYAAVIKSISSDKIK